MQMNEDQGIYAEERHQKGKDAIAFVLVICMIVIAIATILYAAYDPGRRDFITQCVIDNKELPQPDLYCNALYTQTKNGKGGR